MDVNASNAPFIFLHTCTCNSKPINKYMHSIYSRKKNIQSEKLFCLFDFDLFSLDAIRQTLELFAIARSSGMHITSLILSDFPKLTMIMMGSLSCSSFSHYSSQLEDKDRNVSEMFPFEVKNCPNLIFIMLQVFSCLNFTHFTVSNCDNLRFIKMASYCLESLRSLSISS